MADLLAPSLSLVARAPAEQCRLEIAAAVAVVRGELHRTAQILFSSIKLLVDGTQCPTSHQRIGVVWTYLQSSFVATKRFRSSAKLW